MRSLLIPACMLALLPACLDTETTGPPSAPCDPFLTSFTPLEEADTTWLEHDVAYIDVVTGSGEPATTGNYLQVNYTLYEEGSSEAIETSCGRPLYPLILGREAVIPGFEQAITGIRQGGTRRMIVPPEQGYTNPLHDLYGMTLIFDVQAVTVRN